ncbi:MAG: hypothetical protein ABI623_01060 [bacterium]
MGILKINLAARFYEAGKQQRTIDEGDGMKTYERANSVSATENAKKLETIRTRVKNDFYARPEVKVKVVEGVLRDLQHAAC